MAGSPAPVPENPSTVLLGAADVARVVDRIAHQVIEKAGEALSDVVLVGIPTRGAPLARRRAGRTPAFAGTAVDVGPVNTPPPRDALPRGGVRAWEDPFPPAE